jgi:RNA polymerase sigma factor (sigma-70 family)
MQEKPGLIRNPRAWMYRVAGHMVTDMARQDARHAREIPFSELLGKGAGQVIEAALTTEDPDGAATTVLQREKIAWIFHNIMPVKYALCLYLSSVEGLGYREIGERLGIRPGTAAVQLTRAKELARQASQGYEAD